MSRTNLRLQVKQLFPTGPGVFFMANLGKLERMTIECYLINRLEVLSVLLP